ncbi:glycosyltransferase family 4 protein [Flavobacterium sp. MAH-1]|uniref:Glycosyltransferase family 4 protein n=1 Tax=Flavobacterium agri TaxID=2743471 RepID=A0A7Y8Y1W7_9FLAO|nr:glycosyltransferase family 4 protein [Flavobacterium agri]NUY80873.1 glycosyltransferase family 4 protein [Flavobacterium agri]NYA70897.1 glycosyltransferase family 4 protein [Flavobacterium agri]
MRLLYLTDQVYLHGGAEKILIQKLNYWAEVYGYEVALLTCVQKGKPSFLPISERVKQFDLGINYPGGSLYHPKNFGLFKQHYQKLKAFVSDYKPDAVFVVSQTLTHIITPFAAKGFPTYFEYHTSWFGFKMGYERLSFPHKIKTRFIKAITRYAESKYTKIVLLNQTEFDKFKKKNAVVIPNFYDETAEVYPFERKKTVITLGRLSREKGYDLLIEAWKKLDGKIENWELVVYGEGAERQKIENQLSQNTFRNPVKFPGATDNINEKLAKASIYVMSSRTETFPMSLLEALSNGLPVVSFDCPSGPRHIITQKSDGFLMPPNDTQALADQLLALMNNEGLRIRMSENAIENVKRFSAKSVMKQWEDLIRANRKDSAFNINLVSK